MFRKSFRCAAALLSMVMIFQTLPVNALSETDISAAAIWDALVASRESDVPDDEPIAEEPSASDGASKSKPQLTSDMLEEIDFSSKRLLAAAGDPDVFTEDTHVLSLYDGIYMLAYADEEETKNAYTYYYEITDFVEPDSAVFIADDDYTADAAPVFSDSAPDAFTQLNLLLGADETVPSGSNKGDSPNFGYNFPQVGFNAFTQKPHYNAAIIDTGAANGVTDSVSVIGGDGVDDNGHGAAAISAVKSSSNNISVLSVKAFDRRGVAKMSAIYAAVAYAVRQGVDVINLPFDVDSKTDSVVLKRAIGMAQKAGITVVGALGNNDTAVYAKINNSSIFEKIYVQVEDNGLADEEYINIEEFFPDTIDYEAHDQLIESESTDHPLLELSELEDETMDAINSEPVVIAEESDEDIDWSKPPVQDSVTVDNTTIERLHIRWLSTSDGANTPAYFGRLKLAPTTDVVRNQMFQIDFALSGQRTYQPGEIELTFPAYLWLDRNGKEPGELILSIPREDQDTSVEFVWKRVDNNIVITNAKPLSAASKVMIQGTFRNVAAHDMVDGTVSPQFGVTLTVTTPNNKTATMTSNTIDAEIDTEAHVSYANKTAYNSVTGTYDVYWMEVPSAIPLELLPENPENYAYVRWYVAGTADGNQPYKMYVEDTIAYGEDGKPEFGGIMLGVSDIPENDKDPDVHMSNGTYYKKSSDQKTIKALLYDGYSTIVKSAYVWTAYPKGNIPEKKVTLNNTQTISVTGWDDSDRCEKNQGCTGCKNGQSCEVCPDCKCTTTREASAQAVTKAPTTYTFVKHWDDIVLDEEKGEYVDNYWKLRPDEMILRIYCREHSPYYPWRTILLTAANSDDKESEYPNDWTYTWSDEGQVRTYSVSEEIDESKRKGIFKERYDESGHQLEWQYVLKDTEYDEETHTWTYTNVYDDGWIKFELSTLHKTVEYKYQDSSLKSTRDSLSLNQLLRGNDVYVQYPITSTISVAKPAVGHEIYPNRFVLEDAEYYFNENRALTVEDVDISEVTFDAPVVYKYTDYDKVTGDYDKDMIETPETTLYGKVGNDWIPLVTLTENCTKIKEENGAKAEQGYGKSWKVTMPDGKLVSHIKIELESDPNEPKTAMADMRCTVTLRVKPTDAVKAMINNAFGDNDFLCFNLDNKAKAYAIYLGEETKREEDEYGEMREYKQGDTVTTMEYPATGYLHGRVYRVAAELEKSFTYDDDIEYITKNQRIPLHSVLTLTQQSDITSRSDYDYALEIGEIPNTNSGTYYDLLPYGVEPDTDTVKVGGSDSIKDVWTIPNYKDSGRTMLVVKVNLVDNITYTSEKKYKEGEGSKFYPEKGYKNTHTLTFDSYYSTKILAINNGVLRNVAAYEAAEGEIGNVEDWMGEPDDPTADNHNQSENAVGDAYKWMTDLDPNSSAPAFVYAGDVVDLSDIPEFAITRVEKQVSVTGSGEWSKGEKNDVNVQEGGLYSYRLSIYSATDTTTSDIILLDTIENYIPNDEGEDSGRGDEGDNQWHGTLMSIDLSQVESAGVKPVVYYSTVEKLDLSQKKINPEQSDSSPVKAFLANEQIWSKVEADKLSEVDWSEVKAIAIDMTKAADGSEFKLESGKELLVYLNMRAPYDKNNEHPDYFKDKNGKDTDGTDHTKNAHAYNDIYLNCVQNSFSSGTSKVTYSYINNSYTKVGIYTKSIEIKKEWDDDDDADAKRPDKITVKLLDNDKNVVEEFELSEKNSWSHKIDRLLTYDENGNYINYTFVEAFEGSSEYKLTVKRTIKDDGSVIYTLNNYHEPEKINIPITKVWQDEDSSKRPSYITVKLYAKYPDSDERVLVRTLNIDSSNGWKGVFEGLNKYAKGKRIKYSVEEEPVYDYVPDGEPTGDAEKGFTILNKYHPYGNLIITKHVVNGTDEALKKEFTFTLTLKTQDGKDITDRYDYIIYDSEGNEKKGKIGNGGEFTLKHGERIEIKDIPTHIKYTVTETGKSGFTLTKTVNDTGEIVSWPDTEAEFTNEYSADGSAQFDALKLISGCTLLRNQFKFELYEKIGADYKLLKSVYNDGDGTVSFGQISYTNKDDNVEHVYKIVELNEGKQGYTYDEAVYYAKVIPHDNGDGTMKCDVTYYSDENLTRALEINVDGTKYNYPVFQNEYHAEGNISLSAWKSLDGRSVKDGEFTFNLYDKDFNLIGSAKNKANGRIEFKGLNALKYTEANAGETYWYYAREVYGDDPTVVYDTAVIAYRVEVADNGNGTLSFNQSSYYVPDDALVECEQCEGTGKVSGNNCGTCNGFGCTAVNDWEVTEKGEVPMFKNSLADGSLSVSKYTKDGTDPDQEFHFKVKLIGEKIEDDDIEYEITDAEEKAFPATAYSEIAMPTLMGLTDPFSRFRSFNIDEDVESNDDYLIMPMAADGASGTSGGVTWRIEDTTLIIEPTNKVSGDFEYFLLSAPWSEYAKEIEYVKINGDVKGGMYFNSIFFDMTKLKSIEGLENLDVSNVTSMSSMFSGCSNITSLEQIRNWNVGKVNDMSSMFANSGITSVEPIEGWNVTSLKNISDMFEGCENLKEVDLSSWRPNVNDTIKINRAFKGCNNLKYVNLSGWCEGFNDYNNTWAECKDLFIGCPNLQELYMANWEYYCNPSQRGDLIDATSLSVIQLSHNAFGAFKSLADAPGDPLANGSWVKLSEFAGHKEGEVKGYTGEELLENGEHNEIYVWEAAYQITFDKGEEESDGDMVDTFAPVYGRFNIPESRFTRSDYKVIGWQDKNDSEKPPYMITNGKATIPAHTYSRGEIVTLIPKWGERDIRNTEIKNGEFDFWLKGGEKATFDYIPAGTAYQVWEETPDGWVLVKQVDASGVIEPLKESKAEFYNLHQTDKTQAVIYGAKLFDNKAVNVDADGNEFRFELYEVNEDKTETLRQTVSAQEGGFIQFGAIEYDKDDVGKTFTYIVREKAGDNSDIKYDTREWEVTVTVTKTEAGALGTTVKYKDKTNGSESTSGVRFENTTHPGSLELSKVGEGVNEKNKDTEFKFRVKFYNENGLPLTDGSFNWYVKDAETGEIIKDDTGGADDTGSGEEEQKPDINPDDPAVIAVDTAEYPIMTMAADDSISHPANYRVVDNTLILEPADGNSYGVLPNITSEKDAPWYNERTKIYYVKINGDVRANKQASRMFYGLPLKSLEGLANLDVSGVENMQEMFRNLLDITSLKGLETWDVSNVTNMQEMFRETYGVTTLEPLKDWDVSNVTNMHGMFGECHGLKSLIGLENWDVGNVKSMDMMFYKCMALTNLKGLETWDVGNVTNMQKMFQDCYDSTGLTSVASLKYWNVSNVTNMEQMFFGCKALKSLKGLEDWNVKKVTKMKNMFYNCGANTKEGLIGIETADLSGWETNALMDPADTFTMPTNVFNSCPNLKKLYLDKWQYNQNSVATFNTCSNISEIRFSAGALASCLVPTAKTGESAGVWVNIKDLKKGPKALTEGLTFTPKELHDNGVAGETYVWLSYYTINLDANKDYSSGSRVEYGSVKYDYEIVNPFKPISDEYVFVGWEDQDDNVYNVIDGVATIPHDTYQYNRTVNLTAKWAKAGEKNGTYRVEYYQQDIGSDTYTLADSKTCSEPVGAEVEAPLESYKGFVTPDSKKIVVPADDELVVKYYYDRTNYTVHFEGNGADSGSMSDLHMFGGIERKLGNKFTKNGYLFLGWNTKQDGSGDMYYALEPVKDIAGDGETITLYAQWWIPDQYIEPSNGEIIVSCKAGQTIVIDGLPAGTTYEIEEIDVPDVWEVVDEDNVSGWIYANRTTKASVTNMYSAKGSASITSHKKLLGADLTSGMFDFELWPVSKYEPAISHTIRFDVAGNDIGGFQTSKFEDSVSMPGVKKLHVKMRYFTPADAMTCNVYVYDSAGTQIQKLNSTGTSGNPEIEFDVDGDTVTFLAGMGNGKNNAPADYWAEVTEAVEPIETVNGTVDEIIEYVDENGKTVTNPWYGTAPVTFSGLEFTEPGEYKYQIREKIPESGTEVVSKVSKTDAYNDAGIPGNVNLNGKDSVVTIPGAESLYVEIKYFAPMPMSPVRIYGSDDSEPIDTLNGSNPTDTKTYNIPGDTVRFVTNGAMLAHYYAVVTAEIIHGDNKNIVYDERVVDVTVKVTDKGNGMLNCEVIYDTEDKDEPLFTNILSGELEVSKKLEGADNAPDEIKNMEFSFLVELKDSEGNPLTGEYDYTVYNSDGTANKEKSGTLTVADGVAAEYIPIKNGEKFKVEGLPDGTQYTVTEKDSKGFELKEKTGETGAIASGETAEAKFTNTYNGVARLYLSAIKEFGGGVIGEEMFEFLLTQVTDDGQILEVLQEKVYAGTDGKIIFDPIDFTDEDVDKEFFFAITEVNGGLDGILYDKHRAIIKVIVTKDENGNLILVTDYGKGSVVSITDNYETEYPEELVFVNNTLFDLDVSKTVAFGEQDRDFNFTLILKNENGLPDSIGWEKSDLEFGAVEVPENSQEFVYEFTLKHGETIKFKGLPYGTEYSIIEEELDDYKAQATTSTVDEAETVTTGETADGTINADVSVGYLNRRIPKLPNTGGRGINLFCQLGMALICLAGILYSRKRRYSCK